MEIIREASVEIRAPKQEIVDKKMEVFYNPVMKMNRDFSVLILKALEKKNMRIADPMAGSGIRGLRFLKELNEDTIKEVWFNDKKANYEEYISNNFELNNIKNKFKIFNEDANIFLIQNKPFDYIDIDPFGTPNPFLDAGCRALKDEGILAVTATDTSALCGSYPKACRRKYWAEPLRNEFMHEIGLRILIRKVQLMGLNHQRALFPIISYSADHYMRVYFEFRKGKKNMDLIYDLLGDFEYKTKIYGPLYKGEINNLELLKKMLEISEEKNKEFYDDKTRKLLKTLLEETKIPGIGFYDIHKLAKNYAGKEIPKFEFIFEALRKNGFKASRTHFSDTGIKSDANKEEFKKIYELL